MKQKTVLVRGARQLLTLHGPPGARRGAALGDPGIIHDGAVLISGGIIQEVGLSRRIENLTAARGAQEIDVTGKVVLPGFVDSHTHLIHGAPRLLDYEMRIGGASAEAIAAAGGGVLASLRTLRETSGSRLRAEVLRTLRASLASGTTTLEAKSGYGADEANEVKSLRVVAGLRAEGWDLVPTYLGANIVPPEFAGRPGDYIDWCASTVMPTIARRGLALFADIHCGPGSFSVQQARVYLSAARQHFFHLKLHAGPGDDARAAALAVESKATSVDHLTAATEDDARLLASSDTIATLLPGVVFHLGLGRYAPARMLINTGAAVALATGFNPGTCPSISMPMALSLACTAMQMTPAEAIAAATINAAHAVRAARRAGSIEFGKEANLVVFDTADYREIPYSFGVNLAQLVMRRGEIVYRAGRQERSE